MAGNGETFGSVQCEWSEEMKPKWIDVPACRIYEAPIMRLGDLFDLLNENSEPVREGEAFSIAVRKSDRKQFRPARFIPRNYLDHVVCYFEEW